MTDNQRRKEEAEKGRIIESEIEIRIENLGCDLRAKLWSDRKAGLKTMTLPELRQLAQELQRALTLNAANSALVKAITDSGQRRREADDKKFDDVCGTAESNS
jgi:hypothetical protein